jgi:hypothetical protein
MRAELLEKIAALDKRKIPSFPAALRETLAKNAGEKSMSVPPALSAPMKRPQ